MDSKTFIDILSRRLNVSQETVGELIGSMVKVIGECGSELDSVAIPSFGVFEPRKRPERVAMHPATGQRLLVPPKINLAFRPSGALKQRIRNGK